VYNNNNNPSISSIVVKLKPTNAIDEEEKTLHKKIVEMGKNISERKRKKVRHMRENLFMSS
jgi:16S rRNA A1518/A1519 N6-dimethyltransferase RsmA/KsgA/DIM1 with predicted DNA glycosylase/AP lyase activity